MKANPTRITETERPLRAESPANVQLEVWHLLRRNARTVQTAREESARKAAEDHSRWRAHLIDLARAHHQLRVFLERNTAVLESAGAAKQAGLLATIRDRYEQVLKRADAELVYLDGLAFDIELSEQTKVTAWVPAEGVDKPQVRETVSPGVRLAGELICPAEVEVAVPPHSGATETEPAEQEVDG